MSRSLDRRTEGPLAVSAPPAGCASTHSPQLRPPESIMAPAVLNSDPEDGRDDDFDSSRFNDWINYDGTALDDAFDSNMAINDTDFQIAMDLPKPEDAASVQTLDPLSTLSPNQQYAAESQSTIAEVGSVASSGRHSPTSSRKVPLSRHVLLAEDFSVLARGSPLRNVKTEAADEDDAVGRRGLSPDQRQALSSQNVFNFEDQDKQMQAAEKTESVREWLHASTAEGEANNSHADVEDDNNAGERIADKTNAVSDYKEPTMTDDDAEAGLSIEPDPRDEEVAADPETVEMVAKATESNRTISWATYDKPFQSTRPWVDTEGEASSVKGQPESSRAAMARFERRAKELDAISTRATIGSRRRSDTDASSLISAAGISIRVPKTQDNGDDQQGERRTSLIERILPKRSLSNSRKRSRDFTSSQDGSENAKHHDTPFRFPSLHHHKNSNPRPRTPSINTIDVPHQQQHSTSPRSAASLVSSSPFHAAAQFFHRNRSKSDIGGQRSSLGELLAGHGGPIVSLLTPQGNHSDTCFPSDRSSGAGQENLDTDSDDDHDVFGLSDRSYQSLPVPTSPTFEGFKKHVEDSNPGLQSYLVHRLVTEQLKRYKRLVEARQQHEQDVSKCKCESGTYCEILGTGAEILEPKKPKSAAGPPATFYVSRDAMPDDAYDDKGAQPASFPDGIPLPPVTQLPAKFECPFCFLVKSIWKPSDFTKHVHEDLQPFTCTFPDCSDARSFKRKADWVRHENEAHRRLEYWVCSEPECDHICYRKDNFAQHLVREHKLPEPKQRTSRVKQKSEGGLVMEYLESQRRETPKQPEDEPCRFCGRVFTHWKKLTVHMAKHMEYLSLPLLQLVDRAEMNGEALTSPVEQELEYAIQQQMDSAAMHGISSDYSLDPFNQGRSVTNVEDYNSNYGQIAAATVHTSNTYDNHLAPPASDQFSQHWGSQNDAAVYSGGGSPVYSIPSVHTGTRSSTPHSVGQNLYYQHMEPTSQIYVPPQLSQSTSPVYLTPERGQITNPNPNSFPSSSTVGTTASTYPPSLQYSDTNNLRIPNSVSRRSPAYTHEDYLSASPSDANDGFTQDAFPVSYSYPPMAPHNNTQQFPTTANHSQLYGGNSGYVQGQQPPQGNPIYPNNMPYNQQQEDVSFQHWGSHQDGRVKQPPSSQGSHQSFFFYMMRLLFG